MSNLIKLKKNHWINADSLDYKSYLQLFPKGNEKHYKDLTGKDAPVIKSKEQTKEVVQVDSVKTKKSKKD